ncbi:hypothetical protein GCM10020216_038350 [Nonomuraea helvata]
MSVVADFVALVGASEGTVAVSVFCRGGVTRAATGGAVRLRRAVGVVRGARVGLVAGYARGVGLTGVAVG